MSGKAIQPKVKGKLKGKTIHIDRIQMTLAINQVPYAQFSYHVGSEAYSSATKVTSSDLFKEAGSKQNDIFKERTSTDVELKLEDGNGGKINFKGYMSSPQYSISGQSVGLSMVALGEAAMMDNLNPSCYMNVQKNLDNLGDLVYEGQKISEFMWTCYQTQQSAWNKSKQNIQGKIGSAASMQNDEQHTINKKVEKYFQKLTSNSKDTFGWDNLPKYINGTVSMAEFIIGVLTMRSGGFITTVNKLCSAFQCLYVPAWDDIGKMVNRNKLFESPKNLELNPITASISAGNRGMFPVRYIGVLQPNAMPDLDNNCMDAPWVAAWPEKPKAGGTAIRDSGPLWFTQWPLNYKAEKSPPDMKLKPSDIKKPSKTEKAMDSKSKVQGASNDFLKEWAKSVYIWEALGASQAVLLVPLNFNVELGKRYKVKNGNGDVLFEGLLSQVSHNIVVQAGTGSAQTSLTFTHVELTGFSLPDKK